MSIYPSTGELTLNTAGCSSSLGCIIYAGEDSRGNPVSGSATAEFTGINQALSGTSHVPRIIPDIVLGGVSL
ncbi:hypothetical protein BgiMline_000190 [Biomphalaria glabrata]